MSNTGGFLEALYGASPHRPLTPRSLNGMSRRPRLFVSFDYENDVHYKRLLEAWAANSRFQLIFQDLTPHEVQTDRVDRVKAVLTSKVKDATHTLVIIGQYANQLHADRNLIGCRNWINYEIQQSRLYKKKIIGVRIRPNYTLPEMILGSNGRHVEGFTQSGIIRALSEV